MDKKNTAPKFSKSMSETQVLEYIRRLVEKASHDPLEISITFYPGKLPIYQVCPICMRKEKCLLHASSFVHRILSLCLRILGIRFTKILKTPLVNVESEFL